MEQDLSLSDHTMVKIDGATIRRLRESKGLTQLYVATVVGVTTDTISRWENKRYQTIKRGNGLKLAEALETRLDEILDHRETAPEAEAEKPAGPETAQEWPVPPPQPSLARPVAAPKTLTIAAACLLIIAAFIVWRFNIEQAPTTVTASRRLPATSPPGQVFPVAIDIASPEEAGDLSLIIQEHLPAGVTPVRSFPSYTSYDAKQSAIRWLVKTENQRLTIIYLARISAASRQQELTFDGQITSKGRKTIPFSGGPTSMETAPFHWADGNRDNRISDEEILAARDAFGGIEEIGPEFTLLESIWSGSGYSWDEEKKRYVVLPR